MSESSYINRPKEDEPAQFDNWSGDEIDQYLDSLDLPGLQQLFRELCGPYARPALTAKEARQAIYAWIIVRQLERDGILEPVTDDQAKQEYRHGQRVFTMTSLGRNYAAGLKGQN
jgi:hypothetical protein